MTILLKKDSEIERYGIELNEAAKQELRRVVANELKLPANIEENKVVVEEIWSIGGELSKVILDLQETQKKHIDKELYLVEVYHLDNGSHYEVVYYEQNNISQKGTGANNGEDNG